MIKKYELLRWRKSLKDDKEYDDYHKQKNNLYAYHYCMVVENDKELAKKYIIYSHQSMLYCINLLHYNEIPEMVDRITTDVDRYYYNLFYRSYELPIKDEFYKELFFKKMKEEKIIWKGLKY